MIELVLLQFGSLQVLMEILCYFRIVVQWKYTLK